MFKPDKRLKKLYEKYNKMYFDSLLPNDVAVGWIPLGELAGLASSTDLNAGESHYTIYIDTDIRHLEKYVKLTLLHEMAHVKLHPWSKHGKRFDEEMLRLALRGAFNGIW